MPEVIKDIQVCEPMYPKPPVTKTVCKINY